MISRTEWQKFGSGLSRSGSDAVIYVAAQYTAGNEVQCIWMAALPGAAPANAPPSQENTLGYGEIQMEMAQGIRNNVCHIHKPNRRTDFSLDRRHVFCYPITI